MTQPPGKPTELLRLGSLEAQVMEVLWDRGPSSVRDIINTLANDPAYTTIATVLTNLHRKDMVLVSRQQRSTRYAPRLSRDQHAAGLMEQALATSGDRVASILHFVDSMPQDDLTLLREYLQRRGDGGPS